MIKLFGWERKMSDTLKEKREDELAWVWKEKVKLACIVTSSDPHNVLKQDYQPFQRHNQVSANFLMDWPILACLIASICKFLYSYSNHGRYICYLYSNNEAKS